MRIVLFAGLLLLPLSLPAAPLDTFSIRVGGFLSQVNTEIRADDPLTGRQGSLIDFDQELGLEDRELIEFVGLAWRPWQRHEFGVSHFHERLEGGRRLGRDLEFAGHVFEFNADVYSKLVMESFEFHYTWWATVHEDWAAGIRFGYLDYRIATQVILLVSETGSSEVAGLRARTAYSFPAPSIGFDLRIQPAERWRVNASVGWLEADLERISPQILTARIGLEYLPWENIGLWVDAGLNHLDADIDREHVGGSVLIEEGGLRLGMTYRL